MQIKKKQIEVDVYIAEDGTEFSSEKECVHYELIKAGKRKVCRACSGTGKVLVDDDIAGDGGWGSSHGVTFAQVACKQCNGKGYLDLVEVWR